MVVQPWQPRPPVPYWDLWPAGAEPNQDEVESARRAAIQRSSVRDMWQFFGMDVFNQKAIQPSSSIEADVFCKQHGWIYKIEAIVCTADTDLFLTVVDGSSGRKMLDRVSTYNISGGDAGKSYAGFSYILGPRHLLQFKLENATPLSGRPVPITGSVLLLGKLYRGEL